MENSISGSQPKLDRKKFKIVKNKSIESEKIIGKSLGYWKDSLRRLIHNKIASFCLATLVLLYILSWGITLVSKTSTIIEPQIPYPNNPSVMVEKRYLTSLPPRIKGLEWIGWFNGKIDVTIARRNLTNPATSWKYKEGTYTIKSCEIDKQGIEMCKISHDMYAQNNVKFLYFPFGTDDGARDQWIRVWYGVRNSISIGILVAIFDIVVGTLYGAIAGFYGGTKIDNVMMRFAEIYGSIPSIVLLILLASILGRGFWTMVIAMVLTGWINVAMMIRAQFLRYRDHDFVLASKTVGASNRRLIFKHILPNVISQLVILAAFDIPAAIFYEATLSFIGLGLPVNQPSLGNLITRGISQRVMLPYMLWIPTIILSLILLAINLLANGLRDSFDPRLRGR
ncbi:ABC transporter permease [Mycoplasmatota bacterium]|nr:ABC transporter permease [Mycoplasmatota bacterium]